MCVCVCVMCVCDVCDVCTGVVLGFTVWGLSEAGLLSNHCTIASALLFGTICAAVDPVAVSA